MNTEQNKGNISIRNNIIFTLSLVILLIYSGIIFDVRVYLISLIAVITAFIVEYLFFVTRKIKIGSSFFITPLLLVMLLPPTIPYWMTIVGTFFAVFFAKGLFGGEGKYIYNPAIVGILFLTITFPAQMNTSWLEPISNQIQSSTPLTLLNGSNFTYSVNELLMGYTPGSIGETFRLGIIMIGILLLFLKIIDYRIVFSFLLFFLIFTFIANRDSNYSLIYSLLTGSVLFASVFVISDPTCAPVNYWSKIVYGVGLALITVVIRQYAAFPEGIIFSVIIMNTVSPLLDSLFQKEVVL